MGQDIRRGTAAPGQRQQAPSPSPGPQRRNFAPWLDAAAQPLIRVDGVSRRFGEVAALSDLSLSIYEGEFFALLGPSGCGKSTLLRMLAGFERPDSGRIRLAGEDITEVPPHLRPVNMMFQSYALFPHMTVAGNIAFGLKQERLPKAAIAARVEEMLALVQLGGLAGRKPHELSGGQRQRVALARALAKKPKVLLLDEPLGALDKRLREETQFELMDLQSELGATFVVVTHDQEEAMVMADRMAVMERGRILQLGTPEDVYEQPTSRAVAEFVGEINLFEGTVEAVSGDGVAVRCAELGAVASFPPPAAALQPGSVVTVAVRPEKLRALPAGTREPGLVHLAGQVWDIGYLGDWTVIFARLASGKVLRVTRANAARRHRDEFTWDDEVVVAFDPADAVLLTT